MDHQACDCCRQWRVAELDLQCAKSRLDAALLLLRLAPGPETQRILDASLCARDDARQTLMAETAALWSRFGAGPLPPPKGEV